MKNILLDLKSEIRNFLKGQSIDAMFPPIIFILLNSQYGIFIGILVGVSVAVILTIIRILRQEKWQYAMGGLLGLIVAAFIVYITNNASSYFIPKIITSVFGSLITLGSLLIGKPIAILTSHLSRSWPTAWYMREDVKPAYREVSYIWLIFFITRSIILISLLTKGDVLQLVWMNTLLGLPATISVLSISYVYGILRLRNLKGPSVEEFELDKDKPWKGQTKGF